MVQGHLISGNFDLKLGFGRRKKSIKNVGHDLRTSHHITKLIRKQYHGDYTLPLDEEA